MKPTNKYSPVIAAITVLIAGYPAAAETITKQTIISQKELPNVEKTNFSAFDLNGNGVLSMSEVGEKLFYIFDTDGNESIDNIEFNNKKVMTVIPMEKQTFTFVDMDDNGTVEQTHYTHELFIRQSRLMRFDENMDGLSPADFIESSFIDLDRDNSKIIEIDEWKKAYIASVSPLAAEQDRYN